MNYKHLLFLLAISFILNSCSDDEDCCPGPLPEESGVYSNGLLILNEGNFGSGNSSVTFIDSETGEQESSIFNTVNEYALGDTAQSIKLTDELALIVLNVSNTIEIVNRYSFESIGTISENLQNPRYAEIIGDQIYVSNWGDGSNPDDDFIAVFNLADFSFIEKIGVAEGPEYILANNENLFIAHQGGYGYNNIVSVLDSGSKTITNQIEVGYVPNSMVIDGSNLIVLSSGKPSYADEETAGNLSVIDLSSENVTASYNFPAATIHPGNLSASDNQYYFTVGKAVYNYSIGEDLPSAPEFVLDEVEVLYGFEVNNGLLYVSSPNTDFTGDGNLYVFDAATGDMVSTYSTGINPNGVYFN